MLGHTTNPCALPPASIPGCMSAIYLSARLSSIGACLYLHLRLAVLPYIPPPRSLPLSPWGEPNMAYAAYL